MNFNSQKASQFSYLTQSKANYWDRLFYTPYIMSGNNRDGITLQEVYLIKNQNLSTVYAVLNTLSPGSGEHSNI